MLSIMLAVSCKKTKSSWLQPHRYSRIIKIIRGTRRREGGRGGVREGREGEEVGWREEEKHRAPLGAAQPPVSQG